MLTREEFLQDSDLKREEVEVPGGAMLMRALSIGEKLDTRKQWNAEKGDDEDRDIEVVLALVATSLCSPDGSVMFGPDEIADAVVALKNKSEETIKALQVGFARLNGVSEDDIRATVGNSDEITTESSSSDSPVISDTPQPEASPDTSPPTISGTGSPST